MISELLVKSLNANADEIVANLQLPEIKIEDFESLNLSSLPAEIQKDIEVLEQFEEGFVKGVEEALKQEKEPQASAEVDPVSLDPDCTSTYP